MMYAWKEWNELSRGKGMWIALSMIALISVFILLQSRSFPADQGFEVFLLSLYEMNVYIIPLLGMFLSSFSLMQEKEQKTLMILLTKRESYFSFLVKKTFAIQGIILLTLVAWYFILALPAKFLLSFSPGGFFSFLGAVILLTAIFNQLGLFLGSVCSTRIQLVGANIFVWFFFLFLIDLLFLGYLPSVTKENIFLFSIFYFLDPLHTIHLYLESSLGLFPLNHLSRLMEKMIWASPAVFLLADAVIWIGAVFLLSIWLHRKGEKS
ncbi:ABC transporter permease subunit [Aneurinibacillus tyrosinisolvens]|uniref:ABC transporter permease subunit n=1 Tax=Aneurinibacillus tyrosinisolvens TaxID=1443435 RepID=UPI00063F33CD|nr:ABC transporter permease subunit [Aneurinibacillus tyrosinisolvens]